jgi:drug/metabolite transporter (DMT)-like permease
MSKELRNWILLLILACVWGSSFILMKKGMEAEDGTPVFSDAQVGALRMFLASSALLPLGIRYLGKINSLKSLLALSIVGFSGNFFPAFLFTYAESGISSGFAGMLNSFTPIFTILIGLAVFKAKLTAIQLIGILVGTVGIYFLVMAGQGVSMTGNWSHVGAVILATLLYGISLNTIKYTLQQFTALEITSLAFTIIFLPSLFAVWNFDAVTTLNTNPNAPESLVFIGILALIGTALAVILFNRLISSSSAIFASSVTYFIPIVAVLIGFNFGEKISLGQVLAMCVILSGVSLINLGPRLIQFVLKKP